MVLLTKMTLRNCKCAGFLKNEKTIKLHLYTKQFLIVLCFNFTPRAKKGGFKKASKDAKKKYAEKAKEYYGNPEDWTEDILDDLKDIIPDIKSKDLKKVPKDVVRTMCT